MSNTPSHSSLGSVLAGAIGLSKADLTEYAQLGLGAAVAVTGSEMALSGAAKMGYMVSPKWSPVATIGLALGAAALVKRYTNYDTVATGLVAGGIGKALSEAVLYFTNKTVKANVDAASALESQGQGVSGLMGFGRSYVNSFAGLGRASLPAATSLFGVGTPDMSANSMFHGATVAIEEVGGPMAGATLAMQEIPNNFVSALQ